MKARVKDALFEEKIKKVNGCWLWQAQIDKHGYGQFSVHPGNTKYQAHRLAWIYYVEDITAKDYIVDTCGNRHCVNPEHHIKSTVKEHNRGYTIKGRGHCTKGHAYSEKNTMRNGKNAKGVSRYICRACYKLRKEK